MRRVPCFFSGLSLATLMLVQAVLLACPTAGGDPDGAGRKDARCGLGAGCVEGQVCATVFQSSSGAAPPPACFATCALGSPCTTTIGQTGGCQSTNYGEICVAQASLNAPCGNQVNAQCADTPLCLTVSDPQTQEVDSRCVRLCSPEEPSTCSNATLPEQACGCGDDDSLACSDDRLLSSGDGVCATPTTLDSPCGIDPNTGVRQPCTDDLTCALAAGATTGTCAPDDAQ